jgi:TetR/AcrR family transcriptional regulator, mexJK operon transcriptional repressor
MTDTIQTRTRTEKTRERILASAQQLFTQYGFAATSTDAIMKSAGIASKETLYRYYASKEELFVAVLRHLTLEHPEHAGVLRTLPQAQSLEELHAILMTFAHTLLTIMMQPAYIAFLRMLLAEMPRFPHLFQASETAPPGTSTASSDISFGEIFRSTVPQKAMQFLTTVLEQARQAGLVTLPDADAVVRMFIGSLLTYALLDGLLQPGKEVSLPPPERLEAIVEVMMKAMAVERRPG